MKIIPRKRPRKYLQKRFDIFVLKKKYLHFFKKKELYIINDIKYYNFQRHFLYVAY